MSFEIPEGYGKAGHGYRHGVPYNVFCYRTKEIADPNKRWYAETAPEVSPIRIEYGPSRYRAECAMREWIDGNRTSIQLTIDGKPVSFQLPPEQ